MSIFNEDTYEFNISVDGTTTSYTGKRAYPWIDVDGNMRFDVDGVGVVIGKFGGFNLSVGIILNDYSIEGGVVEYLLLEDGSSFLLLESGDQIILE